MMPVTLVSFTLKNVEDLISQMRFLSFSLVHLVESEKLKTIVSENLLNKFSFFILIRQLWRFSSALKFQSFLQKLMDFRLQFIVLLLCKNRLE